MAQADLAEQWIDRIQDYRASGERAAVWCQRNQVTDKQLYYWMAKLRKAGRLPGVTSPPAWAAVSISEVMDVQAQSIIIKVGAAAVEVQPGFDPSLLAAVIKTLKSVC